MIQEKCVLGQQFKMAIENIINKLYKGLLNPKIANNPGSLKGNFASHPPKTGPQTYCQKVASLLSNHCGATARFINRNYSAILATCYWKGSENGRVVTIAHMLKEG